MNKAKKNTAQKKGERFLITDTDVNAPLFPPIVHCSTRSCSEADKEGDDPRCLLQVFSIQCIGVYSKREKIMTVMLICSHIL